MVNYKSCPGQQNRRCSRAHPLHKEGGLSHAFVQTAPKKRCHGCYARANLVLLSVVSRRFSPRGKNFRKIFRKPVKNGHFQPFSGVRAKKIPPEGGAAIVALDFRHPLPRFLFAVAGPYLSVKLRFSPFWSVSIPQRCLVTSQSPYLHSIGNLETRQTDSA